jgi:hypothetical protein
MPLSRQQLKPSHDKVPLTKPKSRRLFLPRFNNRSLNIPFSRVREYYSNQSILMGSGLEMNIFLKAYKIKLVLSVHL